MTRLLALGIALLATAPAQAQLAMNLEFRWAGSWVWTRTGASNNLATFELRPNNRGSYCYDSSCHTVPYRNTNGVITFSSNGTNHFELTAASGGEVLLGRFWHRAADRNGPPAATIRMVKPPR